MSGIFGAIYRLTLVSDRLVADKALERVTDARKDAVIGAPE